MAAEERRKLISDQHLASLSRSISDFKKAATSNTWVSLRLCWASASTFH